MPRHRSSAAKLLLGVTLFLVGCVDVPSNTPTEPADLLRQGKVPAGVVCGETSPAADLVDCLFPPPGLRNAAQQHLKNIVRQYDRGMVESATGMVFDFVDFILSKKDNGQLLDPQPLGQDAAVTLLFDALFAAVGMDPPEIPEGALTVDGAVAVVGPLGGAVFTGTQHFGMDFAENAFASDVLVALVRLPDAAVAGEGPLPTDMDQYGPFYELRVSPAVEAINGITSGLCYHDAGPLAPPDDPAVRSALRIARTVPGTDDEIKVLGWVDAPPFIDCTGPTQVASIRRRDAPALARLGERLGSFLAWALGPAPLSAGSNGGATDTILVRGGGGAEFDAARYGSLDGSSGGGTGPLPDLIVESMQVIPAEPVDGFTFSIQAVVKNIGEGAAAESKLRLYHAGAAVDALVPVGALAPQASETVSHSTSLGAGTYTNLTAYADHPGEVAESDEGNNDAALSFTVVERSNIQGHVSVAGTGLAGVSVEVQSGGSSLFTITDADGAYSVWNLAPGTYTVSIDPPAMWYFAVTSTTITVAPGATAVVDFFGAPLWTAPEGTGTADSWTIGQPASPTSLCNGSGSAPCAVGGSTVTVTAVASGPSGMLNPWGGGSVYFYYIHPDQGPLLFAAVSGSAPSVTDNGVTRFYTWTTTFDALGIPAAASAGQFVAVAVDAGHHAYATPGGGSVQIVTGTLDGDG